jgi:ATP-dependent DNA ligase
MAGRSLSRRVYAVVFGHGDAGAYTRVLHGFLVGAETPRYIGHVLRSSFIPPCHPAPGDRLPKGDGWLFEVKFDRDRMQPAA